MDAEYCVESLAGPQESIATGAFVAEKFRVFTLDVAVDHRQVVPGRGLADEAEFRPRWWQVLDAGAE